MNIRLASEITRDSIVDGEGLRTVIWTQGCPHNCKGCHNQNTHNMNGGFTKDIDQLISEIKQIDNQKGITISGGEPFMQVDACNKIAIELKKQKKDVWCYTGFTFEELLKINNEKINEFLNNIDVLVDGKFILEEKSLNLKYRGSKNQRIINVKKSLKEKRTVIYRKYQIKKEIIYKKDKYLFT